MTSTWLDLTRFPLRRHLAGWYGQHRALNADRSDFAGDSSALLQSRWAAWLGVQPADVLLAATAHDAWHLLARAVFLPNDVAIIAEPSLSAFPAAVLAAGAAYVDVGRRHRGEIAPAALAIALE